MGRVGLSRSRYTTPNTVTFSKGNCLAGRSSGLQSLRRKKDGKTEFHLEFTYQDALHRVLLGFLRKYRDAFLRTEFRVKAPVAALLILAVLAVPVFSWSRLEQAAAKEQAVEAKEQAVAAKEQAVAAKEQAVAAKEQAVEAKEQAVAAKEQAVAAKEQSGSRLKSKRAKSNGNGGRPLATSDPPKWESRT